MAYWVGVDMGIIVLAALILVLQPCPASTSFLTPIFDEVCKDVYCGKGSCKASDNIAFPYKCECSPGWKQALSFSDGFFGWLPCVIPNCTLDFSCAAPAPVPEKEHHANDSSLDVCDWNDCGGGTCNKTSLFTRKCDCSEGYYNLFNDTSFPCLTECSLGMDCKNLGITITNKSTSSQPPSLSSNSSNQATGLLILKGKFHWGVIGSIVLAELLAN